MCRGQPYMQSGSPGLPLGDAPKFQKCSIDWVLRPKPVAKRNTPFSFWPGQGLFQTSSSHADLLSNRLRAAVLMCQGASLQLLTSSTAPRMGGLVHSCLVPSRDDEAHQRVSSQHAPSLDTKLLQAGCLLCSRPRCTAPPSDQPRWWANMGRSVCSPSGLPLHWSRRRSRY